MIYDTLENFPKYFPAGSPLFRALSFAVAFESSRPDGRYEIESEKVFALISSYETCAASHNSFEIHRNYADVQVVVDGEEKVDVSLTSGLKALGEYDKEKDKVSLQSPGESTSLVMRPGYFAVIYPNEAHRPNCDLHGKRHVRKIVVKVRMEPGDR
jgi:YhcH/YjgK/YiaL family protein